MEHQPHPGPSQPDWAKPSAEYLARHKDCRHAWGECVVQCHGWDFYDSKSGQCKHPVHY